MPVKISNKIKLIRNATGHTPPANKGEKEKIKIDIGKICYPPLSKIDQYKNILIFNPVIDWLEIAPPVAEGDKREIRKGLNTIMYKTDDPNTKPLSPVEKKQFKEIWNYKHGFLWKNGKAAVSSVVVGYEPKGNQSGFIKVTLQPSRMTSKDMQEFETFWDTTFSGHPYLKLKNIYQMGDVIKRLDIAVDMLNVHAGSIVAKALPKKAKGASTKKTKQVLYQNSTGRKETHYLPHDPKGSAPEYYYDKKQDMEDKGVAYPYGGLPMTRFEIRLKKPEKPVSKLHGLKNHFKDFDIRAFDYCSLLEKPYTYALFANYALARTMDKAAVLVPHPHKQKHIGFFEKNLINLWQPDLLREGLRKELKRIGFTEDKID